MPRPIVIVTEGSDPKPLEWLGVHADVRELGADDPRFSQMLADAEGLIVRTYTRVTDALLAGAPRLRVVGRGGVGLENIDVAACRRRNVEVVFTPDANTWAVADFVFGYMLQLLRPWCFFHDTPFSASQWKQVRSVSRGAQLNELTLGILGMGRVGRRVGDIAVNGFGMKVLYDDLLDVSRQLDFAAEPVEKRELYQRADVLSLHVTMLPGNENLVGAAEIDLMKPTAVLINTSRGEVLDAAALAKAIRAGRLGGAAVDVYHPEPPDSSFPLLGLDNVLLTPHMAARTETAMQNMSWVVRDVVDVLHGRRPKFPAPQDSTA